MKRDTEQRHCVRCGACFDAKSSWRIVRWLCLGGGERHCGRCNALAIYLAEGGSIHQECVTEQIAAPNPYTSPLDDDTEENLIPAPSSIALVLESVLSSRILSLFVLFTAPHLLLLLVILVADWAPNLLPAEIVAATNHAFEFITQPFLHWLVVAAACFIVACSAVGYLFGIVVLLKDIITLWRRSISRCRYIFVGVSIRAFAVTTRRVRDRFD